MIVEINLADFRAWREWDLIISEVKCKNAILNDCIRRERNLVKCRALWLVSEPKLWIGLVCKCSFNMWDKHGVDTN